MPSAKISYRRCRAKDMVSSVRLVMTSLNDIRKQTGKHQLVWRIRKAPPFFLHLLATDPKTFYCAWKGKRLVGFAGAIVRGKQWYLGWLFVHPKYQDEGVGRRLLQKVWREGRGMTHSLTTMTYNMQAVGLYSRFGMVPEALLTMMSAPFDRVRFPAPTGLEVVDSIGRAELAWISGLDKETRGYSRPSEWRFWNGSDKNRIYIFKRRGRKLGYSMISYGTDIAPVVAAKPRDLQEILAETLRLAGEHRPKNPEKVKLMIFLPQQQKEIYQFLLDSGFRNKEMLLFMSDAAYVDFDRYIPASPAVF